MKKLLLLLFVLGTCRGCEKQEISLYEDKEDLFGEYLGEPDPGDTPERFCPQFFSEEMHTPPLFSPDETYIIFDRRSLSGNSDLYISLHGLDGDWSEAVSLGSSINTSGNEIYPN